jgi:hypothetical protein
VHDWELYLRVVYGRGVPVDDVSWPPSEEEWLKFMHHSRLIVSSYDRHVRLNQNVCRMMDEYQSSKSVFPVKSP